MEIGKNWLLTNQKIESENIEYLWTVEPGACETCLALDGTVYQSANDIPSRPHPNCKCHILPVEKDVPTTDPIELYKKKRREEQRNELLLAKLYGDALSLEQEIDEYNRRIDELEDDIEDFEQEIDFETLDNKEKEDFIGWKGHVELSEYKGYKAKHKITVLKDEIKKSNGEINEITKFQFDLIKLGNYVKDMVIDAKLKIFTIGVGIVGSMGQSDAEALWYISVYGIQYNNPYIKENGKIYNRIGDLHNCELEKIVQEKVKKQMNVNDSRGIVFHENSSLANAIINSSELKKFIQENKIELLKNKSLPNKSIEFKYGNLKNALHLTEAIETFIDEQGNFCTKILDTYDFNPNETNWKIKFARKMQEIDKIQTYYTITKIVIPKEVWENY